MVPRHIFETAGLTPLVLSLYLQLKKTEMVNKTKPKPNKKQTGREGEDNIWF